MTLFRCIEPVLDINGKILRTEKTYFIIPINGEKYGALAVENIDNETCQLRVLQKNYVEPHALEFIPIDKKKGVIRVLIRVCDLNCLPSIMWQLEKYDSKKGKYFINVGPKSTRNWFKIEKYGQGYKFVYCPPVCNNCKVICKDIGVRMVKGVRRLALSDVPLVFNFKKEILIGR
ncbi:kunitz trypsin inhibitor 5-like [Lycium ferocissimum]|uniref:kunitz trypsin inhibitor 5-like n=1 Tax=Lycium ferocissimum TaxID=112874 RepID=UPI0028169A84|nr:kunitz trypsin inhibitor 5-like [Lycium ferocissimum]